MRRFELLVHCPRLWPTARRSNEPGIVRSPDEARCGPPPYAARRHDDDPTPGRGGARVRIAARGLRRRQRQQHRTEFQYVDERVHDRDYRYATLDAAMARLR